MKNFTQTTALRIFFAGLLCIMSSGLFAQDGNATAVNARPLSSGSVTGESNGGAAISVSTFPNPFVDRVRFKIDSRVSGTASVEIFDINGRKLATPFVGYMKAGETQTVEYRADGVSSRNPIIFKIKVGPNGTVGQAIRFN